VNPQFPTIDPKSYPLYQNVEELLESPAFMKNGGTLGFHCAHQYAHTDGRANQRLTHALRGMDVVLFTYSEPSVLQSMYALYWKMD
jgi:hypothetical protein